MANETTNFNISGIDHPVKDPNAYVKPSTGIPKSDLSQEVQDALDEAGSGDGTVTGVKVGSTTYEPTEGVVDISPAIPDTSGFATKTEVTQGLAGKVDKVTGYGLSKNDYTDADKKKLAGIAAGAQVNVISGIKANGASETLPVENGIVTLPPAASPISPATAAPLEDGTAGVGSSEKYAREDHVHPHDTTKQDALTSSTTLMTINGNAVHYGESVTVQGEKGDKGDTGDVQVDGNGNVLIYNGLDKTTTGAALDASQGQFIGKMLNAKDNTFYNVWVGTANDLELLNGDYEDNTIYLVGVEPTVAQRFNVSFDGGDHTSVPSNTPETVKEGSAFSVVVSPASGYTIDSCVATMGNSTIQGVALTGADAGKYSITINSVTAAISIQAAATKHITGITVSAGTRTNNSIPLTAVVAPSGAENVTLAWSISEDGTNYSNSTTHFGISSNGVLTIKEGANNASVTVKCADTNASSDTASGTLQLTGLSYEEIPIPITEITDISATRTAANTLTLEATTDGNTPAVTYSLVGTVPTVKQVRRWAAGDTVDGEVKESAGNDLIELPAVELSGNTLTYKGDCQVTVKATAGNVESSTKAITITHDNADAIWFEDSAVKSLITSKGIGSGGNITYAQAAAVTTFKINNAHTFQNNTTILRFMEYKWFTSATTIGSGASSPVRFDGCTNLKAISTPRNCTIPSQAFVTLKALEELEIDSNATSGFISYNSSYNANLKRFTVGNNATALNQSLESFTQLTTVDLGSRISSVPAKVFKNCSALRNVTLRYNGKITKSDQMFYNLTSGIVDLYVPSEQVTAYASYDAAIKEVHAIEE